MKREKESAFADGYNGSPRTSIHTILSYHLSERKKEEPHSSHNLKNKIISKILLTFFELCDRILIEFIEQGGEFL